MTYWGGVRVWWDGSILGENAVAVVGRADIDLPGLGCDGARDHNPNIRRKHPHLLLKGNV